MRSVYTRRKRGGSAPGAGCQTQRDQRASVTSSNRVRYEPETPEAGPDRQSVERHDIRRVTNWSILPSVVGRTARTVIGRGPDGHRLLKNLWIEAKRQSAPNVRNVRVQDISNLTDVTVTGDVARHCHLVLCALAKLLDCRTVFEIGTYRGEATWLLARNLPALQVFTLDLPNLEAAEHVALELTDRGEYFTHWERGTKFAGTSESARITQLKGDSATFDFSPYLGQMDLVYIDASHSYSYVKSDTEAALRMLAPGGTIVWDDYTHYPGLYAYLNELATGLDKPILHLLETRLAVYSQTALLR
jgi:predicted O-methyltransferase YrrM